MTSHTSSVSVDCKGSIDEAVRVAEDFIRLYYRTLEERPHRANMLYLSESVVIWDGNPFVGDSIQKFFGEMPTSTFNIATMDTQSMSSIAVDKQKAFIINTTGSFRINGTARKNFLQTFIVTADEGKWKVASDVFRSQFSPNQAPI